MSPAVGQPARHQRRRRLLYPALVACLLGAAWQALVVGLELPPYVLPSPVRTLQTLVADWSTLSAALLVTLRVTLLAFALATAAGVAISFLFVQSRAIETALFPYAVLLQVTPIVAIAPLIIIWVKDPQCGDGDLRCDCRLVSGDLPTPRWVCAASTLTCSNYFRLNRATRSQILWRLRIPSALPYFFGGLRISSGLALIGAVVAEFVAGTGGSGAGLAYQILLAGYQLNIPRMFAALLLISLTGIALFAAMALLSRAALGSWHASEITLD